jgi:hypothetical protein
MAPPIGSEVFGKRTSYWKGKLIRYDNADNAHVKMTLGPGRPAKVPIGEILENDGGLSRLRSKSFHIRAVFGGWRGGIVPAHVGVTTSLSCRTRLTLPGAA